MIRPRFVADVPPPALLRLSHLGPLPRQDMTVLAAAMADARRARVRRELLSEGEEITEPKIIVSGWAARARLLADGRRQFLSFLLPGELIGMCRQGRPLAVSTVVALTDVTICAAPSAAELPKLAEVYAISHALDEVHLLGHIARLGRLNAQERIGDLMLEFHERLSLAGLVTNGGFEMPLTQEMLADALGLTAVHVNRMLQLMRKEGDVQWKGGRVTLPDPAALARKVGRGTKRVSAHDEGRDWSDDLFRPGFVRA